MAELINVHDPMCSWCWAFRPVWSALESRLPETVTVRRWLGGLAPDSDQPMPADLQKQISGAWKTIEQRVPGTRFNHDFWRVAKPRRSTYPACRAVLAARVQGAEEKMISALQEAYYLRVMNPSDAETALLLAQELGLDLERFEQDLFAPETQQQLLDEIAEARAIGGDSFPSLFLRTGRGITEISLDYLNAEPMLARIREEIARG